MFRGQLRQLTWTRAAQALALVALILFCMPQATAVQRTQFDHLTTGYELLGAHRDLSCEYCHLQGVFRGTPRNCVGCHSIGSRVNAVPRPTGHIATQDDCRLCHSLYTFEPIIHVDHTAVRGTCFSCHNGAVAEGKIQGHIPSSNNCDACHTTNSFAVLRVDHAELVNRAAACRGCHTGVQASTMPRNHLATRQECSACHGTLAWTPARFDHSGIAGNCQSCHNGGTASGKVANHLATALDCSACHLYPNWSAITYVHKSSQYPGDHRDPACTACHTTNLAQATWQFAAYRPGCAGCHANLFKPGGHEKTVGGMKYNVSELQNCTGACHIYTDTRLTTIAKVRPAGHHKVTDGAFH